MGFSMKNKAISLLTIITFVLIFTVSIFAQPRASADENAFLTRLRISETETKTNNSAAFYSLERFAFDLINQKRTANGLSELLWNEDVAEIARLHSRNMAENNYFNHKGLVDGFTVDGRANSLGVRNWMAIGENIAFNRGFSKPAEHAVESWMRSNGHRTNILNNRWNQTGIGIATDDNGGYYITQVFMLTK